MTLAAAALLLAASAASAQDAATAGESTVTYPAEFFAQYEPYSVNDMLNRIPGINLAMGGGGNNGGPGSSGGADRRGLGAGGDQILINGRRIAGKENEGNAQLARIPANQVQYIEIIRGTSGDLDVRGGAQVINIVLLAAETRSSTLTSGPMPKGNSTTVSTKKVTTMTLSDPWRSARRRSRRTTSRKRFMAAPP
jgi:outer membrane cobalamin receptor